MTATPERNTGTVRTLGVRLPADLHTQLGLLAQLRGKTINGEILEAIETHLNVRKADPALAARADHVLEDIERQAAARRDAIATLFGSDTGTKPTSRSRTKRSEPTD